MNSKDLEHILDAIVCSIAVVGFVCLMVFLIKEINQNNSIKSCVSSNQEWVHGNCVERGTDLRTLYAK